MSEFYIGCEVGLSDDHDWRGVIVDSHPVNGWLVWWCGDAAARWHRAGELWACVDDDAPPPADPALLAKANRMLHERVDRLEAAIATAAETLRYVRGYVAGHGLSAEGDIDEALAEIAEVTPGSDARR